MSPLVRTQISLPPDLKKKIEQLARAEGISLAEYLRRAAGSRVDRTYSRSSERARIAHELAGSFKRNKTKGWGSMTPRQVDQWIRRERQRSDKRLERLEQIRHTLGH